MFLTRPQLEEWLRTASEKAERNIKVNLRYWERREWTTGRYCKRPHVASRKQVKSSCADPGLQRANRQLQSPLLGRLPAEIRNQIYDYCLDSSPVKDWDVHLCLNGERFAHVCCMQKWPRHQVFSLRTEKVPYPQKSSLEISRNLTVMLVCRLMYQEIGSKIYGEMTFCISHPTILPHFSKHVQPGRFSTITSVKIDYRRTQMFRNSKNDSDIGLYGTNERAWRETCRILSLMKGLKSLLISIDCSTRRGDFSDGRSHTEALCEALAPIPRLSLPRFEVFVHDFTGRYPLFGAPLVRDILKQATYLVLPRSPPSPA